MSPTHGAVYSVSFTPLANRLLSDNLIGEQYVIFHFIWTIDHRFDFADVMFVKFAYVFGIWLYTHSDDSELAQVVSLIG